MTETFLTNFLLGFAVAAVIGPVNLTTMRYGLDGFWRGFLCMIGSVTAEVVFFSLTASGIIFIFNDPATMRLLWFFGGLALFYLAVTAWKNNSVNNWSGGRGVANPFVVGFLVDLLNPFGMVFWATVIGSLMLSDLKNHSAATVYMDGFGVVLGIATCLFVLLCAVVVAKKHITQKIINAALKLSPVALMGFSLWFFYHFYLSWYG